MERLYASGEEYLKWILRIQEKNGNVRSIDLAHCMGFSRASISIALKKLIERNFVKKDSKGFLHLTQTGKAIAENFNERHSILTKYLLSIGVDHNTAVADACKIEHVLSEESYQKLKQSIEI